MRVLLDECVHADLAKYLSEHVVQTVQQASWRGIKNGELLIRAAGAFDVFLTADKNNEFQHNPAKLALPIIILATDGNMWEDIERCLPQLHKLLSKNLG